tara:strand:+ start:356 stop:520 length:165 start_codon:yes stop_codon:yes gene_type:complete
MNMSTVGPVLYAKHQMNTKEHPPIQDATPCDVEEHNKDYEEEEPQSLEEALTSL